MLRHRRDRRPRGWIEGAVCPPGKLPAAFNRKTSRSLQVFFRKASLTRQGFQKSGHTVGCVATAPMTLRARQAQIGIAVSTATDVAKSAAGVVLTEAGLGGIVDAVKEGRLTFSAFSPTRSTRPEEVFQALLLAVGLVMTDTQC